LLVYQGKIQTSGMEKAELTEAQLAAAIREHGIEDVLQVDVAMFEIDGNISVVSENYQKVSKRKRKGHRVLGGNTA
jgi:uncharacterized membrane protein YcaP (DUF421 family)